MTECSKLLLYINKFKKYVKKNLNLRFYTLKNIKLILKTCSFIYTKLSILLRQK